MEKNHNMVYSGWKMNGFAALFMVLLSYAAAIVAIFHCVDPKTTI